MKIALVYISFFAMIGFCVWVTGEFICLFFLFFGLALPDIDKEEEKTDDKEQ